MIDAFAGMTSDHLSAGLNPLTALTMMAIPTMETRFYGMNVNLPGQHHRAALLVTVIVSLQG